MPGEDFDIGSAVDEIGSGLGFSDVQESRNDDVELDVAASAVSGDAPATGSVASVDPAGAAGSTADPAGTPSADDPLNKPPQTWKKEVAANWATLPSEIRAEVQRREGDFFKGIEQYKEAAQFGNGVRQSIQQFIPLMQQRGIDPMQQVSALVRADHLLSTAPPQTRLELFQKLASDYGVDLSQIGAEPAYIDPAVADLQSRLQAVQSQLSASAAAQEAQVRETATRQIDAFAADPANTHFNAVSNEMVKLLQAGTAKDLSDAYQQAVWLNPTTRAAEIARQQQEAVKAAQAKQAEKVAEARKALAANVRTAPKSSSPTARTGTMDETLAEQLAEIRSRG